MSETVYALSIKQPWATLLLYGLKTIEVRSWPTARRGIVLIHASQGIDAYVPAWQALPRELHEAARQTGGLIGRCEIADCIAYRSAEAFAQDQAKHLNDPAWYRPPALFGFVMTNPQVLPFRPYPGWVRFFPVRDETPARKRKKAPAGPDLFSELEVSE